VGYMALLPILRRLGPSPRPLSSSASSTSAQTADKSISNHPPNAQILAHLLAHIFDNYSILSLFESVSSCSDEDSNLEGKLGELVLHWRQALPLLWAYLWGFDKPSVKGKAKASPRQDEACSCGHYERDTLEREKMVEITFRIILTAARASTANLFLISTHLPQILEFLTTRLYEIEPKRKYEVTFPPRDDWHILEEGEDEHEELEWKDPSPTLRAAYLALLRRMLEAGVTQTVTWRLFSLVKQSSIASRAVSNGQPVSGNGEGSSDPLPASSEEKDDMLRPPRKRQKVPHLTISTQASPSGIDIERLNTEVLDIIRHAMKARWPPAFVFRGGEGDDEGGLELAEMGRPWAPPQKGFHFSVSSFKLYVPYVV